MRRKALTPVIAVVLLVFITVAAAGGAFVFLNQVTGEFRTKAIATIHTDVSILDLICNGTYINATLQNTGEAVVDLDPVHIFVRTRSDGNLNESLSKTGFNLASFYESGAGIEEPGDIGRYHVPISAAFEVDVRYLVEYQFVDNQGETALGSCKGE